MISMKSSNLIVIYEVLGHTVKMYYSLSQNIYEALLDDF